MCIGCHYIFNTHVISMNMTDIVYQLSKISKECTSDECRHAYRCCNENGAICSDDQKMRCCDVTIRIR